MSRQKLKIVKICDIEYFFGHDIQKPTIAKYSLKITKSLNYYYIYIH